MKEHFGAKKRKAPEGNGHVAVTAVAMHMRPVSKSRLFK